VGWIMTVDLVCAASFRGNHLQVANKLLGGPVAMTLAANLDELLGFPNVGSHTLSLSGANVTGAPNTQNVMDISGRGQTVLGA